ncbi:hypothetical protein FS594_26460 (plasmid) [Rahnella aquatilis]|nr:hypothetical protein FS594_26460 [Rahnella aquatilis]
MMKVNKSSRTNITWKVKFWIMPVLYLIAWGRNAYVLASPQAMTIGISVFLLMNLFISCLLFKSQFNRVKDSIVNAMFIDDVISKKTLFSFLSWVPLIIIGGLIGELSFMVLSTIAMWASGLIFLLSGRCEILGIAEDAIQAKNTLWCDSSYSNFHEPVNHGVNPATGLPMVNSSYDIDGNSYGFKNN